MEHRMGPIYAGRPDVIEAIRPAYPKIAESFATRYARIVESFSNLLEGEDFEDEVARAEYISDEMIERTAEELGIRLN